MRRFSQRNSLVTLSDINITPLLDLAFVLLIIFVITTPLLEQSIDLRLPEGGRAGARVSRDNLRTVEIDRAGSYRFDKNPVTFPQLEQALLKALQANPKTVVRVRGDRECFYSHVSPVLDLCARNRITVSLATEPVKRP